MRQLIFILWLLLPTIAQAANDDHCLRYALYREARGEGLITQRATYDVIRNRMRATGLSACKVLHKPQQFPYFKYGIKPVDKKWKIRYLIVSNMQSVLPERYMYFNDKPHKWGRNTRRIGKMYFQTA